MLLMSCGSDGPRGALCDEEYDRSDVLTCDAAPELCEVTVESSVRNEDFELAYDLVFVADGFADASAFHARVDRLVTRTFEDPRGIVTRAPDLFNVHRVWAPAARGNARAFGACLRENELDGTLLIDADDARVDLAANQAPDVDVVVFLSDALRGRANASFPSPRAFVRMDADHGASVLTHELGHALFMLGDEYVDVPDPHPRSGGQGLVRPNVSLSADEAWNGLVSRAREGAERHGQGAYRPTNRCRMRNAYGNEPFCPVCSAHIDAWIAHRKGERSVNPVCHPHPSGEETELICWAPAGLVEYQAPVPDGFPPSFPISFDTCEGCAAPQFAVITLDASIMGGELVVRDAAGNTASVRLE
ncbi:MAG: hypothetical protein AAF938_01540 [Myxococcota bacterium]